ncbi:MAG: 2-oxo acid dehydrogenase subunit E2 [Candidatus Pacearchaeota archaeon]|jgi:pyruvate dehydrogenase E2 component (dihydrolipoamide acetyltransferase)
MGTKIFIPKMGANIDYVEIGKIFVKKGDFVKRGQILFEIVTDKATFEIEADQEGLILALNCKEGDEIRVLENIGFIGLSGEEIPELTKKFEEKEIVNPVEEIRVKATPIARKLAKERNINLEVAFRGSDKIIQEEDIIYYLNRLNNETGLIKKEKISIKKKKEIENLLWARDCIISSVVIQVSLEKINKKINEINGDINVSIGDFVSYNAGRIIGNFPKINAFYQSEEINYYSSVNLGMAVSIDDELIVLVIKNADKMSLSEFLSDFKRKIMDLIKKEIKIEDLQGGTFTISDLSSRGVFLFNPVINIKQSAILGICSPIETISRDDSGKLFLDKKLNLILAFDHRVIDGKYALDFLNELKLALED